VPCAHCTRFADPHSSQTSDKNPMPLSMVVMRGIGFCCAKTFSRARPLRSHCCASTGGFPGSPWLFRCIIWYLFAAVMKLGWKSEFLCWLRVASQWQGRGPAEPTWAMGRPQMGSTTDYSLCLRVAAFGHCPG
jgi:hypothetical protein